MKKISKVVFELWYQSADRVVFYQVPDAAGTHAGAKAAADAAVFIDHHFKVASVLLL